MKEDREATVRRERDWCEVNVKLENKKVGRNKTCGRGRGRNLKPCNKREWKTESLKP